MLLLCLFWLIGFAESAVFYTVHRCILFATAVTSRKHLNHRRQRRAAVSRTSCLTGENELAEGRVTDAEEKGLVLAAQGKQLRGSSLQARRIFLPNCRSRHLRVLRASPSCHPPKSSFRPPAKISCSTLSPRPAGNTYSDLSNVTFRKPRAEGREAGAGERVKEGAVAFTRRRRPVPAASAARLGRAAAAAGPGALRPRFAEPFRPPKPSRRGGEEGGEEARPPRLPSSVLPAPPGLCPGLPRQLLAVPVRGARGLGRREGAHQLAALGTVLALLRGCSGADSSPGGSGCFWRLLPGRQETPPGTAALRGTPAMAEA